VSLFLDQEGCVHKATVVIEDLPNLVTADKLAEKSHVSVERLIELADGGIIPHWRVDNGVPLFHMSECRKWIAKNLVRYQEGHSLPVQLSIVSDRAFTEARGLPGPLSGISGLIDISDLLAHRSGIYFLCCGQEVVYVGQSVSVPTRIHAHLARKEFDLDAIEGAMIRLLHPRLNITSQGRLQAPGDPEGDGSILAGIIS
jgi:hypothetical protein